MLGTIIRIACFRQQCFGFLDIIVIGLIGRIVGGQTGRNYAFGWSTLPLKNSIDNGLTINGSCQCLTHLGIAHDGVLEVDTQMENTVQRNGSQFLGQRFVGFKAAQIGFGNPCDIEATGFKFDNLL